MDGILNCDVFVVEGRELRYGVICILCAGEVVELLIGLPFKSLEDRIDCKSPSCT